MSLRNVTSLGSNFALVMSLKRIQTPHSLCCDFGGRAIKPLQLVGQAAEFKFEPLPTISPKTVPDGNRRFRGQNQRPSSWGRSPALLARVGRASTNTGRFRVGGSRCGPRPARLRKTCYHSCDTDSVPVLLQESSRFWRFVNFGPRQVTFLFM